MNKKSLFLCLILVTGQIKPLLLETFACIGVVAVLKNVRASQYALNKVRKLLRNRIGDFDVLDLKHQPYVQVSGYRFFDNAPSSFVRLADVGKACAKIGQEKCIATVTAFQARAAALRGHSFFSCVQQDARTSRFGCFVSGHASTAGTTQNLNVAMHDTQYTQKVSGLFARITNNFHTGDSKLLMQEVGKRKFWQGACFGSMSTAWLLKDNKVHDQKEAEIKH